MPDNIGEVVSVLPSADPKRRVAIVRRSDGLFAVRPERFHTARWFPELVVSSRWIPINRTSGIYASAEIAEKEAYTLFPWIR